MGPRSGLPGARLFALGGAGPCAAAAAALFLWGDGGSEMPFNAGIVLLNWFPLLPLFIFMGCMLSGSGIANVLHKMLHVWTDPVNGGLGIGAVVLMVAVPFVAPMIPGLGIVMAFPQAAPYLPDMHFAH